MKVWVLFHENFHMNDSDDFVGVFSSEDKAKEYIATYDERDQSQFRIDETDVD